MSISEIQVKLAPVSTFLFGKDTLPDSTAAKVNIFGQDIPCHIASDSQSRYLLVTEPLSAFPVERFDNLKNKEEIKKINSTGSVLVLSWGYTQLSEPALSDDIIGNYKDAPLVDGLQILRYWPMEEDWAQDDNIWKHSDEQKTRAHLPGIVKPTFEGKCDMVAIRVGLFPDRPSVDGWWKCEKSNFSSIQLGFTWQGRSLTYLKPDANEDPLHSWIWHGCLSKVESRFFLSAYESENVMSEINLLTSAPLLIGTGADALKLISSDFSQELITNANAAISLASLSYVQDLYFKVGLLIESEIELFDGFNLTAVSVEIGKWWQPQPYTGYTFSGVMDWKGFNFIVSFLPGDFVSGRIENPETQDIGGLLEKTIGGISNLPFPEIDPKKLTLTLSEASITKNFKEKSLSFGLSLKVKDDKDIVIVDKVFALTYFNLWSTTYSDPSSGTELTLEAGGKLFGSLQLVTNAVKSGASWSFFAAAYTDGGATLGDVIGGFNSSVDVPDFIRDAQMEELSFYYNTGEQAFHFTAAVNVPVGDGDSKLEIGLSFSARKPADGGGWQIEITGTLAVGERSFEVSFEKAGAYKYLLAAYVSEGAVDNLQLSEFVELLLKDSAPELPVDLEIVLKQAVISLFKGNVGPINVLAALVLDLKLDLGGLPLVGAVLKDQVGIQNLQLVVAKSDVESKQLQDVNGKMTPPIKVDPAGSTLGKGLHINLDFVVGPASVPIALHFGNNKQKEGSKPAAAGGDPSGLEALGNPLASGAGGNPPPPTPKASEIKWAKVNKTFGPVQFNRLGFQFVSTDTESMLWAYLDAGLTVGPLAFTLNGLGIGTPLTKFEPEVRLLGIGVDFKSGSLEIGGSFLRNRVPEDQSKGRPAYDEYNGLALIKTPTMLLSAIGSYADLPDHKSLFIFATLNAPIGGPAFFFVTGLAVAFGYNRALSVPDITRVREFSLVNMAVSGAGGTPPGSPGERSNYISAVLDQMRKDIYPAEGQYFLAAGVRFTSFNLIDSFVMLTVSFGKRLEVDVLGLSTAVIPAPVNGERKAAPLAEIQLALKAVFLPDEGFLGVEAQLTGNSYVIDRNCRLTGGFAFYTWFSGPHEGDFVLSVGGYHPAFQKPAHYPDVPRLGLNWQVTSKLSITGSMYFALCPHTVMAGGRLEAAYRDGSLKAWFIMGVDFIMGWKPFYYDLRAYLEIGIEYSMLFTVLRAHINADIHIWGPDFAGHARIKVAFLTFEIDFGAQSSPSLTPLSWAAFRESFLPREDAKLVSLAAAGGLVKSIKSGNGDIYLINPKDFKLVANLAIPAKELYINDKKLDTAALKRVIRQQGAEICAFSSQEQGQGQAFVQKQGTSTITPGKFGIAPMGKSADAVTSRFTITATKDGSDASNDFAYRPVLKTMPAALWGERLQPDLNGERTIENLMVGLEILPASPPVPGSTQWVEKANLQYTTAHVQTGVASNITAFSKSDLGGLELKNHFGSTNTAQKRQTLLDAMGLGSDIRMEQSIIEKMVMEPQIGDLF